MEGRGGVRVGESGKLNGRNCMRQSANDNTTTAACRSLISQVFFWNRFSMIEIHVLLNHLLDSMQSLFLVQ